MKLGERESKRNALIATSNFLSNHLDPNIVVGYTALLLVSMPPLKLKVKTEKPNWFVKDVIKSFFDPQACYSEKVLVNIVHVNVETNSGSGNNTQCISMAPRQKDVVLTGKHRNIKLCCAIKTLVNTVVIQAVTYIILYRSAFLARIITSKPMI